MSTQFTLDTLHLLGDGDLQRDFEAVLAGLVKDCLERPALDKPREVKLVVQLKPRLEKDGSCDNVTVSVQVASKAPAKIVRPYVMRATVRGQLAYSPDSPADPEQGSLPLEE